MRNQEFVDRIIRIINYWKANPTVNYDDVYRNLGLRPPGNSGEFYLGTEEGVGEGEFFSLKKEKSKKRRSYRKNN